nr:hypothetical protein [Desulfobacterales bacterium]
MREIMNHRPGKIFLLVLLLATLSLLATTPFLTIPVVLVGWITLPFAAGIAFILVWLMAYLIYFFRYWPFR